MTFLSEIYTKKHNFRFLCVYELQKVTQVGGDGQKHFPKNLLKGIFIIPKNRQNIRFLGPIIITGPT